MTDARRERTPGEERVRDAGSVDGGYASATSEASLGPEQRSVDARGSSAGEPGDEDGRAARSQDESERVAVISGRSEDSTITVEVVGRTDVGLVREHNEDNYLLADLATGRVGEFPEVQGVLGRYYALADGEDPRVADRSPRLAVVHVHAWPFAAPIIALLRQPGDSRLHGMPLCIKGQLTFQVLDELRALGTRADKAHLALQHRPALRELVDAYLADEATDPGDSWVALCGPYSLSAHLCVLAHGAELQDIE